jgi:mono/diheme cytochrome c family protein
MIPHSDDLPDRILSMHEQAVREMEEPKDGSTATPVAFLLMCFFFTAWGGYYIADNPGNWSGQEYNERPAHTAFSGPPAPTDPMLLGKEVFSACTQCHQLDGKGVAGTYPPLVGSEYVTGDERRLAAILMNGINGPFVVNGNTYSSEMPNWRSYFKDEELAAVMTYVRNTWGNKSAPVSKETVAKVRAELAANSTIWTAETLATFTKGEPK